MTRRTNHTLHLLKRVSALLLLGLLLYSCSVERFIPEDKFLYVDHRVELTPDSVVNDIDNIQLDLEAALRPDPVSGLLGGYPGLYFHYKASREKPGFINRFLNKKFGQEPVYDTDVQTYEMEQILLNRLENKGFFYSVATSEIVRDTTHKEAEAIYRLRMSKPYRLKTYQLDTDTLPVYNSIKNSLTESLIKKDMRFDLSAMKAERQRIDGYLKEQGYYNFNPAFLIFETDTNQYKNRRFDLYLRLKKDVPPKSVIPYKIAKVNVYPNNTVELDSSALDTTRFAQKSFIQGETFFKPKRLDPFILLEEGDLYSPSTSKSTSRRLGSIGAYKFVNIRYNELETDAADDSLGLLEANIFLSPLNKRAVRAEVKGVTKSNGFTGPGLGFTFVNRNLFKGGETLNISLDGSYEVQAGGAGNNAGSSSIQLGLNGTLIFPRMLFPVTISKDYFKYDIPKTKMELGVAYLNRTQLFTLGSVEGKFGYVWQANKYVTHEINPVAINYVSLANTTPEFDAILEANPFLQTSFEQQFISGLTYSFIYNGMVDAGKAHQIYFNANFDTAGNSLSLIASGNKPQSIFGLDYAQYARLDADVRYHFNFSNQTLATRLFAGLGVPYGNSEVVPYTKQYFSGGPYSVRAFRTRSLGPGTYEPDNDNSYYDQTGNLRLEANLEYRFPLINVLKGALFVDAGNVWNTTDNEALDGDTFGSDFMSELGIGGGFGLRVDIQSFVIRLDLAAPFHDPSLQQGERWSWDVSNPILNFAIGYPF
ncbi:BamA/TamA family outer membrane protein [Leeuwenhoekiella parthenopeia]|uniref:Outer membrane protein assembly factor n=1 Tax=Leeuwenhoekiella parthenopeia TaxID=2890320 RepID=A0ABS8GR86_9FLAO|nr:BamA/TamA family outer membrane protein [Leeuwenhoekiella parthenopeia]MCC4212306.1 outer membrane protein assembly factor [Leeuwenhoekiella parthenopeia]